MSTIDKVKIIKNKTIEITRKNGNGEKTVRQYDDVKLNRLGVLVTAAIAQLPETTHCNGVSLVFKFPSHFED